MSYRYDRDGHIQQYGGVPPNPSDKEKSIWNKFLSVFVPKIAKRLKAVDYFLDIRVKREMVEIEKSKAGTSLIKAQVNLTNAKTQREMMEIADLANRLDAQNTGQSESMEIEANDIEEDIEVFVEKVRLLKLKYGLNIFIEPNNKIEGINSSFEEGIKLNVNDSDYNTGYLQNSIDKLSEHERRILNHRSQGLSIQEIADEENISRSVVSARLANIRKRLRE